MSVTTHNQATHRIWLVIGDKLGDNAQATRLADGLGMPYETRRLVPRPRYVLGKPRFKVGLEHLDLAASDPLQPPWPDLVITIGRRHSMAALWIKAQNPATRIVLLGRARRWLERFDLVIVPPQYRLPDLPNVMRLCLPLLRVDKDAVARASAHWSPRFAPLEKPLIGVLVGGPTRPYRFDDAVTTDLVATCRDLQQRHGGTLCVSTSRRTPAVVVAALRSRLPEGSVLYEWSAEAADNPYLALLGLADRFVVTGDSVSMMIEVADCGKPLAIFDLPRDIRGRLWQAILLRLHGPNDGRPAGAVYRWLGRLLYASGLAGFARDLGAVQRSLIATGFAVRTGEPFRPVTRPLPDELGAVRERVQDLLNDRTAQGLAARKN
jgi:mitochondrial fission protein ELM1